MRIEFDQAKDELNRAKHGVSLAQAKDMLILRFVVDSRNDYGEERYRAWGTIDASFYCLAFTVRETTGYG